MKEEWKDYPAPKEVSAFAAQLANDLSELEAIVFLVSGGLENMDTSRGQDATAMFHIEKALNQMERRLDYLIRE